MLSEEAAREKEWMGLSYLRSILESARKEFDARRYPILDLNSSFDRLGNVTYLAALVTTHRNLLLSEIRDAQVPDMRRKIASLTLKDLERLRAELLHLESGVGTLRAELDTLWEEVLAAKYDIPDDAR